MKLDGVQRTRRRTFVQLPLNFLCELCVFARDNALTSSPDDSAWEDVVFVSRQDAKLAKEIQRRKAADPEVLRAPRGLPRRRFRRAANPAKNSTAKNTHPEDLRRAKPNSRRLRSVLTRIWRPGIIGIKTEFAEAVKAGSI